MDEDLGLPVIIPVGKTRQGEGGAGQERKNQVRPTLSVHYSNIMPSVSLRELKMFGIKMACFYKSLMKQLIARTISGCHEHLHGGLGKVEGKVEPEARPHIKVLDFFVHFC